MPITLHAEELAQTPERAYVLAIGKQRLPATWTKRAEQLSESPSVAFIAATRSVWGSVRTRASRSRNSRNSGRG